MEPERLNEHLAEIHRCADEIDIVVAALMDFGFTNLAQRLENSRAMIVNTVVTVDVESHQFDDDSTFLRRV